METEWRPLPGYEALYAVSNDGKVKRLKASYGTRPGKLCKPSYVRGYARYALCLGDKRPKMLSAHRLVYEAFVGPIPEGMQINHKNGVKDDNRVENLEIATPSENTLHAYHVLKIPPRINAMPGETNPRAKVGWEQVDRIRQMYASGEYSQQALGNQFGLSQSTVGRIISGVIWQTKDRH